MRKIKVAVIGANGRMGQEIALALKNSSQAEAFLGVVRKGKAQGFKKSSIELDGKNFKEINVIIDFSNLESMSKNLEFAKRNKIPLVSGITGVQSIHQKALSTAAKTIPVLWASNMSLGVAALTKAIQSLEMLKNFDFQIEEFHHNKKKDSPSGTAIFLQAKLEKTVGKKCPKPLSIRGGGIFGVHKIYAMSENEILCFEHTALNRKLFAEGAVIAAIWISAQKKGLYQIQDLII